MRPSTETEGNIIEVGDRGQAVEALQLALNATGKAMVVDGVFGMATRDAVMSFGRALALHLTG